MSQIMMPGKLTKAELSRAIARNCRSSLKEGKEILELILSAIAHAISKVERVEIRGFGTFATRVRKTRIGRNPKAGTLVKVPAKRVPYFRPSKDLRASLVNSLAQSTADRTVRSKQMH